ERTGAAASLRTALREVCLPRVARRGSGLRICLSWHHRPDAEAAEAGVVFHNGSTGRCTAFVGFDRAAQTGLVALAGPLATGRRRFAQTANDTLRALAR
ncbi:MAG: hypothetical protein LBV78_23770, partial [Kitasatospora sp.]|nr:hypothetical protein [Kitasatospora sp.]